MKKILSYIISGIISIIIIFHFVLFLCGIRFHAVKTDSMDPDIPKFSFLYVEPYKNKANLYEEIFIGEDIVFLNANNEIVVHRVVFIDQENDIIQTQSIREGASLDPKISSEKVIGKVNVVIPIIGFIPLIVQQWYFWVILVTLIAIYYVTKALIKEIKKSKNA